MTAEQQPEKGRQETLLNKPPQGSSEEKWFLYFDNRYEAEEGVGSMTAEDSREMRLGMIKEVKGLGHLFVEHGSVGDKELIGYYNSNNGTLAFVDTDGNYWIGQDRPDNVKRLEAAGYKSGSPGMHVPASNDFGVELRMKLGVPEGILDQPRTIGDDETNLPYSPATALGRSLND